MADDRVLIVGYYWSDEDVLESGVKKYTCLANGTLYEGKDDPLERQKPKNYKGVTLRIKGLYPWVYLEYPSKIPPREMEEDIKKRMGAEVKSTQYVKKKILDQLREVDLIKVTLQNSACLKKMRYTYGPGYQGKAKTIFMCGKDWDTSAFMIHEEKIDQLVKNAKSSGFGFSDYFSIPKEYLRKNGFSNSYYSVDIDVKNLKFESDPPTQFMTSFCVIDFEQYSHHHDSSFPNPIDPRNDVFQVGIIHGYMGFPETYKKYLLTTVECGDIEGVTVANLKDERSLFTTYSALLSTLRPQALVHYNGLSYDLSCEYTRCKDVLKIDEDQRKKYSIVKNNCPEVVKVRWSSKAYGESNYHFYDGGWVQVDVKVVIERDFKLPSYSLKKVAEHFLKDRKMDLTPRQMFMIVRISRDFLPFAKENPDFVPQKKRIEIKKKIINIFPKIYNTYITKKLRENLLSWSTGKELEAAIKNANTLIGIYCVQDCYVTIRLCDDRNMWEGFVQLSKVTQVPISYLLGKGTLVKVGAMMFSKCFDLGIVLNSFKIKEYVDYQGAYVVDGNPGYHEDVLTFDFFSLYPTNIISGCMDYTCRNLGKSKVKNVFKWDSHENCVHGNKKIIKGKKTICGVQDYSFDRIEFDRKTDKPINEGVLPILLNEGLDARVKVKFEMAVYEVAVKAHDGKLNDPEKDLAFLKTNHAQFGIVYNEKKGGLPEHLYRQYRARLSALNARQLAIKVFLNSAYGGTGAQRGPFPCIDIASSITYLARIMIVYTIKKALELFKERNIDAKLVYGDTDSCMISVKGLAVDKTIALGIEFASLLTHYVKLFIMKVDSEHRVTDASGKKWSLFPENAGGFPRSKLPELNDEDYQTVKYYDYMRTRLEFEKFYPKFLFFTKKRYIADVCNTKGKIVDRTNKGCILVRRDNIGYSVSCFRKLSEMIMNHEQRDSIFAALYEMINSLFTDFYLANRDPKKLKLADFIMYMGVKNLIEYASKKGGHFVDSAGNPFVPETDPFTGEKDPFDPRLQYSKLKQSFFIKKLIDRGQRVVSGTRVEMVYIETPEGTPNCEKVEDYTYYKEKRSQLGLKLDFLYYFESKFVNPISELLTIRYRGEELPYVDRKEKFDRLFSDYKPVLKKDEAKLAEYYGRAKAQIKSEETEKWTPEHFTLYEKHRDIFSLLSGQKKMTPENKTRLQKAAVWLANSRPTKHWSFADDFSVMEEKYGNVLKSAKLNEEEKAHIKLWTVYRKRHLTRVEEVEECEDEYELEPAKTGKYICEKILSDEIVEIASVEISIAILNKLCKKHKQPKYKDYETGMSRSKVALKAEVYSSRPLSHIPAGKKGVVINKKEIKEPVKKELYTIEFPGEGIVEDVERSSFVTLRYKDGYFMQDILTYRKLYKKVVENIGKSQE